MEGQAQVIAAKADAKVLEIRARAYAKARRIATADDSAEFDASRRRS